MISAGLAFIRTMALAKRAPVLAFKWNEPMRDMIFVEEIVDQVPIARAIRRDDAQAARAAATSGRTCRCSCRGPSTTATRSIARPRSRTRYVGNQVSRK